MPRPILRLLMLVTLLIMLGIFWRYLIESGALSSHRINELIQLLVQIKSTPWLIPSIVMSYLILLTFMFPLTILVICTGFLFSPGWAIFYATLATLCSSALSYWIGHWLGREAIEKHGGRYLRVIHRFMQENSVHSMIVINLLPIAPFTMTNMMAGAFKLHFSRYMIGSAIGIIPGLTVVTLLGGQLSKIMTAADKNQIWMAMAISLLLVMLLASFIYWVMKKEHIDN